MRKLRLSALVKPVLSRGVNPSHVMQALRLQRNRKKNRRTLDDDQLKLYAQILPKEFLHFGLFEDPSIEPDDISLNCLLNAQQRYADALVDHVQDKENPVLDVGCGMGAISRMLYEKSFSPVALTPDKYQVGHIQKKYPFFPVIRAKFEDLCPKEHGSRYGTLLTSESLQYLKLDRALPLLDQVIKPGGRWIACDYFHREVPINEPGHHWDTFTKSVSAAGWKMVVEKEITANVLPTLKYVYMWASRLGIPLMEFAWLKLRRKQPAIHHLLEPSLEKLDQFAKKQMDIINPTVFSQKYRYMQLVLERA